MKCPNCTSDKNKVIDTHTTNNASVRRRRRCCACKRYYITYEIYEADLSSYKQLKEDQRRLKEMLKLILES